LRGTIEKVRLPSS